MEYPVLHEQDALPDALSESDGQAVHAYDPDVALNFPASHSVQLPAAGPVLPAAHKSIQSRASSLPEGAVVPYGQG